MSGGPIANKSVTGQATSSLPLSNPDSPKNLVAITKHPAEWFESAFFRNTDWPALLINLVVLALAIFGVIQALAANRKAKETSRRLFEEDQFKAYGDTLLRPKSDLDAVSALARSLTYPGVDLPRLNLEVDSLGQMLLDSMRILANKLRSIDDHEKYGSGWENVFAPFRQSAEEAYDVANDPQVSLEGRKAAAIALSSALLDGLRHLNDFEFTRRQGFGKNPR